LAAARGKHSNSSSGPVSRPGSRPGTPLVERENLYVVENTVVRERSVGSDPVDKLCNISQYFLAIVKKKRSITIRGA
jgi:hypothetical protein